LRDTSACSASCDVSAPARPQPCAPAPPTYAFRHPVRRPSDRLHSPALHARTPRPRTSAPRPRPPHQFEFTIARREEGSMRIVGLTGGITSGKSTVSNLFTSSGVPVVDADVIARYYGLRLFESTKHINSIYLHFQVNLGLLISGVTSLHDVIRKGTRGWRKVVAAFGEDILQADGEIDMAQLGQIVFSDPGKRQLLNCLLAPYISSGIFWEIIKLWLKGCMVIVLDIPLLFEAKMDQWKKPIIVVWVDPETQLKRLMTRDKTSEEQANNRINAQMSLDWKRDKADIVIDNSGSLEDTKAQFHSVLATVTKPISWKEFALSRKGVTCIFIPIIVGVLIYLL
ncbi:hypothetical protein Taro_039636, partial [Colocasia esculenta]|nr:hypothetical protein [Colocasia esculenta]